MLVALLLAQAGAAVTLTALLISPVAMSQPPGDGGVSAAPTLPLVQLGAPADLAFYGIQGTETLTIPVPSGLAPVALNVTTQLPVNVQSATVTVMQEDRTLSRVDIPPGERVPVSIPLAGAEIVASLAEPVMVPMEPPVFETTPPSMMSSVPVPERPTYK